jgi:hypothetical protein
MSTYYRNQQRATWNKDVIYHFGEPTLAGRITLRVGLVSRDHNGKLRNHYSLWRKWTERLGIHYTEAQRDELHGAVPHWAAYSVRGTAADLARLMTLDIVEAVAYGEASVPCGRGVHLAPPPRDTQYNDMAPRDTCNGGGRGPCALSTPAPAPRREPNVPVNANAIAERMREAYPADNRATRRVRSDAKAKPVYVPYLPTTPVVLPVW